MPRRVVQKHSAPEGQYLPSGVERLREALGTVKSEKPAMPKRLLEKEVSCRQVETLEASWALRGQLGPER